MHELNPIALLLLNTTKRPVIGRNITAHEIKYQSNLIKSLQPCTCGLRSTSKPIHKKTLSNYAHIIQKLFYLQLNYAVTVSTKNQFMLV